MGRTPLFGVLERALRAADRELTARSRRAAPEHRKPWRPSRRELLRTGGAVLGGIAAAQIACSPVAPSGARAPERRTAPRVVIVGAGLAGLTCAYRLSQSGIQSDVFDANDRVGGRTFTLHSPKFAGKVELGGEFIDSGHTEIRALAAELGLSLVDLEAGATRLEPERYFIGGERYSEQQIVELFLPVASSIRLGLDAIGEPLQATYAAFTPHARELDHLSIPAWLDRQGIGGPVRALLEAAYTAEYGLEADEQSCLNLLYLIGTEPFALYGESDERYTLREGNDALCKRMAAALPVPVRTGHHLARVRRRADGSLLVSFLQGAVSVEVVADTLVLAIPFNQLRKVELAIALSPAKQRALSKLRYATNAKLTVSTTRRPWLESGASGTSFNDAVYHQSWDSSRGLASVGLGVAGMLTSFCGGKLGERLGQGTSEEQGVRFVERLERVYPGTRAVFAGQCARFHWPSAAFFEGSYACYGPGDYTSFVGSEGEVEGNVHFAGEHTSKSAQGYMQGAVESGERAARELQAALGIAKAA